MEHPCSLQFFPLLHYYKNLALNEASYDFYGYLNTLKLSDNFASFIIPSLIKLINIIAFPLGTVLSPISIGLETYHYFLLYSFEKYFYPLNKILI